jgi:hypothetical protein
MAALPGRAEENICLLFEAGAQSEDNFLAFKAKHEYRLHSLYIHPQLLEFQNYGPWLLEIDHPEQLQGYLDTLPGCIAVIISTCYPPSLAVQLSRGCTIVPPEGSTALVRFYANHVIEVLATCAKHDWHAFLFNGITQWWLPGEVQWQLLSITPSEIESPTGHIIRLDKTNWQQIADKPEVTSVLNEWQRMPTSQQFPPCAQRLMVVKALNKADLVGLNNPKDRMLYALCYLDGRKDILESEALREQLSNIVLGKQSLSGLVIKICS